MTTAVKSLKTHVDPEIRELLRTIGHDGMRVDRAPENIVVQYLFQLGLIERVYSFEPFVKLSPEGREAAGILLN